MADKTIGELPSASSVSSGSYIPIEQSGRAYKMTGAQFADWAVDSVATQVAQAANSATQAATSAARAASSETNAENASAVAATSANNAESARQAIEDMGVASTTLESGSEATVSKSTSQGVVTLTFGLPRGAVGPQGETGPQGAQGVQGPKGDTGTAVAVETAGMYYFNVDNDSSSPTFGHLMLTYTGDEAPDFSIDNNGHLIWNID